MRIGSQTQLAVKHERELRLSLAVDSMKFILVREICEIPTLKQSGNFVVQPISKVVNGKIWCLELT